MHLDEERSPNFEKRSPDLIREYFDLLRWKKKDCPIELSPEVIENDESLGRVLKPQTRMEIAVFQR